MTAASVHDFGESGPLLAVEHLSVVFETGAFRRRQVRAVDDVSFTLRPHETVGIVGGSGSGKTTLGRSILGLTPVRSGSIRFAGRELTHLSRRARRAMSGDIQVVFQDPFGSLNPSMTVGEILTEPLTVAGTSSVEAEQRVRTLLEQLHLPRDAATRYPHEFSGGQRQRVAIARALSLEPRLIVCDEPVSGLDLSSQLAVLDLFVEIQERTGVAYLFITHDLAVVRHISHRVIVMNGGRIVEQGEVATITSAPTHAYTRRLLLSAPVPDVDRQRERRQELRRLAVSEVAGR